MVRVFIFLLMLMPVVGFGLQNKSVSVRDTSVKTNSSKLNAYGANHAIEKAYLQFDKPYYVIGDTVYFKAYVTVGVFHKLSALSGVLNVDLIDPHNKIAKSEKLQIIAGVAWGDFALADTLEGGSYRVRAYTNWMLNTGDDAFFEQIIPVGGLSADKIAESGESGIKKRTGKIQEERKIDFQFLPEGGRLVAGNYSKIAFKAVDSDGLGVDVEGTLSDETGAEVCSFTSAHLGMGSFPIVPIAGKIYKAAIVFKDGTKESVELPKATNNGYTINMDNGNADTIRIRITGGLESPIKGLKLIAQSDGAVYYAAENQSNKNFFSAVIPKSKFPTGIIQFTLFSPNNEPLNERLVFINHNDRLNLALNTAWQNHVSRQKVTFGLAVSKKNNKPAIGSFSVSVINQDKVPVDTINENTILIDILLTSELKGTIEQPGYYFSKIDKQTQADMDNLMLTQGYRHFEWKKILADTAAIDYQPGKAMQISGIVKKGSRPVAKAKVKLFSKAAGVFMLDTLTDEHGRFTFDDLIFNDSTKFVVQAKVKKGQDDVKLELETALNDPPPIKKLNSDKSWQPAATDMSAYVYNQREFYAEQQKYGINQHPMVLKEVKIEARKEPVIPHSENLNGAGNADQVLTAKDIERFICGNIVDCLRGVLTGVILSKTDYPTNVRGGKMAIVIDGNFAEPDEFVNLNPDAIEGIEVLLSTHSSVIYGTRMAYGGIVITTKRASKTNNYYRYAPGVVTYMPKGFYKAREFYSPQYDNPHTNQKMADLRSTIYWNPNIITDKDGKASFSYFNADGKGTYRVVIEGIDADGNLGRQVFKYKVE